MWTDCSNARIEREGLVLSKTSIFRGLATINSHIVAAILIEVMPVDPPSTPCEEAIPEQTF